MPTKVIASADFAASVADGIRNEGVRHMIRMAALRLALYSGTAFAALAPSAWAQGVETTPPAATPTGAAIPAQGADQTDGRVDREEIIVTGSRIRRDPNDSALPLQIITTQELERNSISNPEQLLSFLTSNGTAGDNLASNADVVTDQQRGNNGASFANLRGQGSGATLVLVNGRRIAAHGLSGAAVDINQIPFAAIERVEVLKEGASAIYGTDAIGGVINFILRKNYEGLGVSAFADITEAGDAPIYRTSAIAGYGDLEERGFNIMGAVSYSWIEELRGAERSFVDTFQPERGLSVDTRGTPHATIVPLGVGRNTPLGTIINNAAGSPFVPGTAIRTNGGINVLDLPGGEGCNSFDGQEPYDEALWEFPQAQFACAWDTGRAAVLQQPLDTLTYLGRAVARFGSHEFAVEATGSDATATKRFSNLQITPNTTAQSYGHPSTGVNYDTIFNRLVGVFPTLEPRRGLPISYRWRCIECGPRVISTDTETFRIAGSADGPIAGNWDYRAGVSYATSESQSTLGSGYYFRGTDAAGNVTGPGIIPALNTGIINPFLLPGQAQSEAALNLLQSASAEGVVLYGGKYTTTQVDGSVSGPLFDLPGGTVRVAAGLDYRKEEYEFNGDVREAAARPFIIAAPFDDGNALEGVDREIKAAYAEILIPVIASLEVTGAVRVDEYDGFGTTVNPLVAVKFRPIEQILLRGNYNTGFRAPTFNQLFNGRSEAQFTGRDLADPARCPGGIPNATDPNCVAIQPDLIFGGNPDLGPETAEQFSLGAVFQPAPNFSLSVDYWSIDRSNTPEILTLRQLVENFEVFPDNFIRDAAGTLVAIDQTWVNAGATTMQGLEIAARGAIDALGGTISASLDGTYLIERKEKLLAGSGFGPSQIGVFTFSRDLNLRWKHNAVIAYSTDRFGASFTQIFRKGYTNQELPGVANGSVTPPDLKEKTDDYITYTVSAYYNIDDRIRLIAGVKNVFDTDPPFAVTYDSNTGSGSSWEARVADPRGRSFTMLAEVRF